MSGKPVRVVFLGAGAVNFGGGLGPWDHATRLEKLGGVKFVGIVDPLVEKARSMLDIRKSGSHSHMYSECGLFSSLEEFLKVKSADAAVIGIPPVFRGSLERDVEIKCIEAGIHCFIEKPLSVTKPEDFTGYYEKLLKTQQEKNVIVSVGYMFRYHSAVNTMKSLIDSHPGVVMAWNGRFHFAYSESNHPFRWNKSQSGGSMVEQATHFIDLARYLVGEVHTDTIQTLTVPASDESGPGYLSKLVPGIEEGLAKDDKNPRVTSAMWKFKSGGIGSLMHTIALHGRRYESHIEVIMDGLRLTLYEPYHPECKLLVRDGRTGSVQEKVYDFGSADPYEEELKVFLEAIEKKDSSQIKSSYADAVKTYNLSWDIRKKAEMSQ